MTIIRAVFLFLMLAFVAPFSQAQMKILAVEEWENLEDKHFIVFFSHKDDTDTARRILNAAERYYSSIAEEIGYARYTNFWTWNERVHIVLFPDQFSFTKITGQPMWSRGYALRDASLRMNRTIVTYRQEENFENGVLPHEISHLIMQDYFGMVQVPLWFEEGIAQMYEDYKGEIARKIVTYAVLKNMSIPFGEFHSLDVRRQTESMKVTIFYGQSYSVVKFLIRTYGIDKFRDLCREIKEGKEWEEALKTAYYPSIESFGHLESKWKQYVKDNPQF